MINKTDYPLEILIWEAIFLFLFQLKASRNIDYFFGQTFLKNFKNFFPLLQIQDYEIERMPNHGTLIDLLCAVEPEEISKVTAKMVGKLIRSRKLEKYRLENKYYLIAVDATKTLSFSEEEYQKNPEKHKHCLRRKIREDKDGTKHYQYYYYALEAKLVTSEGLALSVITEFIENESQDVVKQDCELKAFYRLAKRLKEYFPRTEFCLLFDSLYAGAPTFKIIKDNGWQAIINFKEGSMPAVYQEYLNLLPLCPKNTGKHLLNANTHQNFRWVNNIDHKGVSLHVLECQETIMKNKKEETTRFLWISLVPINFKNYKKLAKGGRCRWKVENQGFNVQKNGGYELEHAYSKNYNAIKSFYLLLQIAHTLNQLMIKGNLIKDLSKIFGSIKNFIKEFLTVFTRQIVDTSIISNILSKPYQIRFDSS